MTLPGVKLAMVAYLFLVTFIIYATFGLSSFEVGVLLRVPKLV